jgi:Zn-dependent protease
MLNTKKYEFNISKREIKDLSKAWLILSLAFAIAFSGFSISINFLIVLFVSAITVGTAFILHELGHKITAQHYGCFAEFKSFDNMLWLALIMSFFGIIFAAPGAVMIKGPIGKKRNAIISAAGPIINIILAIIFLLIFLSTNITFLNLVSRYGFMINSWIAMFNLIPFAMFDGKKIIDWNKKIYFLLVSVVLILFFIQPIIN